MLYRIQCSAVSLASTQQRPVAHCSLHLSCDNQKCRQMLPSIPRGLILSPAGKRTKLVVVEEAMLLS